MPWLAGENMLARDAEDLPVLLQGLESGQEGAAGHRGFDHQGSQGDAAYDAVSPGKVAGVGHRPQGMLAEQGAFTFYLAGQPPVLRGIDYVQAAAEHCDGASS